MSRIIFQALLGALLTYQVFSVLDLFGAYKKQQMSNKAQIMSNVSLALYWALRRFIPVEMVPDQNEWLKIDGKHEVFAAGGKYTHTDSVTH